MSIIEDILDKYKVKFEDLEPEEMETLNVWLNALEKGKVTTQSVREYIQQMKTSVEEALVKEPEYKIIGIFKVRNDKNIYLKARIKNYLLLESFLMTPQRARNQVEQMVSNLAPKT